MLAREPTTPLMRAMGCADFCSGTSSLLDVAQWSFVNADLCVHLVHEPVGEGILVEAENWVNGHGSGLAMAMLVDVEGYFGQVTQCIVVDRGAPAQALPCG